MTSEVVRGKGGGADWVRGIRIEVGGTNGVTPRTLGRRARSVSKVLELTALPIVGSAWRCVVKGVRCHLKGDDELIPNRF